MSDLIEEMKKLAHYAENNVFTEGLSADYAKAFRAAIASLESHKPLSDSSAVADESKARKRGLESEYTRVFVSRHDNFDNLPVDRKVEFRELHWLIRELDRRLDQGRE